MKFSTSETDRVLDALSPALAAEIERIKAEVLNTLEADFAKRLEKALAEAALAAHESARAEIEHAVAGAREEVRQQMTADLDARLREVEQNVEAEQKSRLEEELKNATSTWEAERTQLQEQIREWRAFADIPRLLAEATSQPEILARFLKLSEPFAPAIGVYVAKVDGLALWKSRGQAAFPEIISEQTTDPESFFRVICVRGKTVAAVCAMRPYRADELHFITGTMERAIELFGLRLRASGQAI